MREEDEKLTFCCFSHPQKHPRRTKKTTTTVVVPSKNTRRARSLLRGRDPERTSSSATFLVLEHARKKTRIRDFFLVSNIIGKRAAKIRENHYYRSRPRSSFSSPSSLLLLLPPFFLLPLLLLLQSASAIFLASLSISSSPMSFSFLLFLLLLLPARPGMVIFLSPPSFASSMSSTSLSSSVA